MLKGIKELFSGSTLKTVARSVGAVAVAKMLPGVTQMAVNKIGGSNVEMSGPVYALGSAVVVAGFCYHKNLKTEGNVVLAYAVGEQALFYANRSLATTLPSPLVLPATTNAGLSDFSAQPNFGMSDGGYEAVPVPNEDGVETTKMLKSENSINPSNDFALADFTANPPVKSKLYDATVTGGLSDYWSEVSNPFHN